LELAITWGGINVDSFFCVAIRIEFDNLLEHCNFVKESIKSEMEKFSAGIDKATAAMNEETKSEFLEWHQDDAWRIYDVFPSIQWMSSLLLAYGIFEKTLNDICRKKNNNNIGLSVRDISGQGIERAKTYLQKVCGINTPFSSSEWNKIVEISKIRNVIAHTSGTLYLDRRNHSEAFEAAKKIGGIKIIMHDQELKYANIELTADFVTEAIKSFRDFSIALLKENAG
jgi:hypothetical protein